MEFLEVNEFYIEADGDVEILRCVVCTGKSYQVVTAVCSRNSDFSLVHRLTPANNH